LFPNKSSRSSFDTFFVRIKFHFQINFFADKKTLRMTNNKRKSSREIGRIFCFEGFGAEVFPFLQTLIPLPEASGRL